MQTKKMEATKTLKTCFIFWAFASGLCSASSRFQDQKNFYFYYTPYPVAAVPPPTDVSNGNPPPAGANDPPVVSYGYPPPAQPNNPPPDSNQYPPPAHANDPPVVSYQNPPPAQDNNPPSGGGSTTPVDHRHGHHHHHHHGQKPPTNCDLPPSSGSQNPSPSPLAGSYNNPPSGGGTPTAPTLPPVVNPPIASHNPPPPSGGCNCGVPPSSTPTGPVVAPSPTEHQNPNSPTPTPTPTTGYHYPPPAQSTTPRSNTPSTTPRSNNPSTTPPVTGDEDPSPPAFPNIPLIGGTCDFWRTHPRLLSDLFRWWSNTIGRAFGLGSIPGFGSSMNMQEALSNTGTDGISALYREGTAALLNSMVSYDFPFTTSDVRDSFVAALSSDKVAAAQAEVFKLANEGRLKPRA